MGLVNFVGTGARCGDGHILDAKSRKVSIMCPKMRPKHKMCPNDAQNMSNLADYVQKASKLQGNVHNVSNLWTLYGHIEFRLVTFWTFVVWGTKYVQTWEKYPKYVHNVSKIWTLLWAHRRQVFSKRKVSTFWTFFVSHTKHVQTPRKCPKHVQT